MNGFRRGAAIAAACAALGAVALSASPAAAQNAVVQGWRDNGNPGWQDQQSYAGERWGDDNNPGYRDPGYQDGYSYRPVYDNRTVYDNQYARGYGNPDWESGAVTVPVCPEGYSLGATGRLCWPD